MNKIYRLKPWNEVENHHFMFEDVWNKLADAPALNVERLGGFMGDSVLISVADDNRTFGNTFIVDKGDLYEVEEKTTPPTELKEKTYTKEDIRIAGARAMADIENEDDAVVSAIAIAKLIHKL